MAYKQLEQTLNTMQIYRFIDSTEDVQSGVYKGLKFEVVEGLDQQMYNSYGYEDSTLKRIYFFPDYNCYVMFEGTRASFAGEEWDSFKQVTQTQKTITTWE